MGKVFPKDRKSKNLKRRRRSRCSSQTYLKPGALSQLRHNKVIAATPCTDLGRKRVAVLDNAKAEANVATEDNIIDKSPLMLSPVDFVKHTIFLGTPKTPRVEDCESESRLESLPTDLLVGILCYLHHDQLRAVFHVSRQLRKAVLRARQFHFNYTTPDRSRQEMLRTMTPLPTDRWPFVSKGKIKDTRMPSPHTPKAPRHGPRLPSRLKISEIRQVAAVLFQEVTFPSPSLHDALRHLYYQSPFANHWLLIEFCSTRMNYARQWLKISFVDRKERSLCIVCSSLPSWLQSQSTDSAILLVFWINFRLGRPDFNLEVIFS